MGGSIEHSSTDKRQRTLERFDDLNTWKRGDERAPHKPLLLLLALGRYSRGAPREFRYLDIESDLARLLQKFGPPRKSYHPEFPFYHLKNDGIWTLQDAELMEKRQGASSPKKSELVRQNPPAGITSEVYHALTSDPSLIHDLARRLLDAHFPPSMHMDILDAAGLRLPQARATRVPRDPEFRVAVLRAYQQRCAVCALDLRLGGVSVAIEAAHIRWHQANGPDEVSNGVALCVLHHKLFDRGAMTVSHERKVLVSQDAVGHGPIEEYLLRLHNQPLAEPLTTESHPAPEHLRWHHEQVFRGPARASH